jgi:hypothetical protein
MSPRRTKAKDLSRRAGARPERRTVVVFCEGEASEPDYINALKRLPEVRQNTSINIEIDPGQGVPLTLVKRAVDRKRCDDEVDECWCLFDVEWPKNHPNLAEAIQLASAHGISLAVSNPCFELWLILHLEDHTAFISTADAEKRSRRLDRRSGKRIDAAIYMRHRQIAADRASALAARHKGNQTDFPKNNPSSTMYELLEVIRALTAT